VVIVTRIDRLARSTFDLFAIVKQIVDAEAQFRSLAEPWADTGTSTGRLMIAVLGGLAEVERDLIRTRTAEGRSRAKSQGQHMGRPPALSARRRRKRPHSDAQRALRCKNSPAATMSVHPPFAVRRGQPHDGRITRRRLKIASFWVYLFP
jgi:DNA invertase Pin-like site-specific DNA recombinase